MEKLEAVKAEARSQFANLIIGGLLVVLVIGGFAM